jgi:uncharacterized protein YbjT (DUF2867 family)
MARICVLGGTGFIGQHLLSRLAARGDALIVPTRYIRHARDLFLLPTIETMEADIHDDATLARLVRGCDAVVNLVGILRGRGARSGERYGAGFRTIHVDLPRRVAALCADAGVEHVLHMSALGASADAPSEYLRSKADGEKAVLESRGINATVFRPSVVFGPEDRFLNLFARLQRLPWLMMPVMYLGSPDAKFQPVYVGDVVEAMVAALFDREAFGRRYDLCGPKVYTLRELVEYTGEVTGHRRPVIALGESLSSMQAAVLERLPGKLLTRDNVQSMKVDNVCACDFPFGIEPGAIETLAPAWLAARDPRMRLYGMRSRAHR